MIYRVKFENDDGNKGYYFATSLRDAYKEIHQFEIDWEDNFPEAEIIERIPTPKKVKDWIKLINRIASHNDNG